MSDKLDILSRTDNVLIDVMVSPIAGSDQFLANAHLTLFDPENQMERGGPVTKKSVKLQYVANSFDSARDGALEKGVDLLGLGALN